MTELLWLAVAFPITLAATWAMLRPGWKHWAAIFGLVTLLQPVLWMVLGSGLTPFRVLKTLSVAAAGLVITELRRSPHRAPALTKLLWGIFAFNILQAAGADSLSDNLWNPLAGVLLCLAISAPVHGRVEGGKLQWDLGWPFIAVYTLWNFAFIYGSAPPDEVPGQWTTLAALHLGVPLVLAVRNPRCWAEARVAALYLSVVLLDNAPGEPWVVPSFWTWQELATPVGVLSFVSAICLVLYAARPGACLGSPARTVGRRLF